MELGYEAFSKRSDAGEGLVGGLVESGPAGVVDALVHAVYTQKCPQWDP